MGGFSLWHWLIVLVIVVLVFGTKRLGNIGKDLGDAVKGFKKGMQDERHARRRSCRDESRDASSRSSADSATATTTTSRADAARRGHRVGPPHVRYRLFRAAGHRRRGPARARPRAPAEGRALRRPVGAARARAVVFGEVRTRARARRRRAQAQPAADPGACARCRTTCSAAANRCGASSKRWAATCSPQCPTQPMPVTIMPHCQAAPVRRSASTPMAVPTPMPATGRSPRTLGHA